MLVKLLLFSYLYFYAVLYFLRSKGSYLIIIEQIFLSLFLIIYADAFSFAFPVLFYLNSILKASSTFDAPSISILYFFLSIIPLLKSGIIILLKPNFSASLMR